MFKYTRAVLNETVSELKFIWFLFCVVTQIIYLAYLTYAVIAKVGLIYLNIPLLIISAIYLVVFLILHKNNDKKNKKARQISAHVKTIIKLAINAVALAVAVYGIYVASTNADGISIMLTTLMLIFWCAQVVLEIIVMFFEKKADQISWALTKDVEPLMNVYDKVANAVRWVKGEEKIERDTLSNKAEKYLQKVLDKFNDSKKQ